MAGFDDAMNVMDWMQRRRQDLENAEADYAAGLDATTASIRNGQYLSAPTTDAVRALGADARGQDAAAKAAAIRRGDKAILTDKDIAGIIFNETRSFSGSDIQKAREHVAHALMNADETWGSDRARYAKSAPGTAKPPKVEMPTYQSAVAAVAAARAQRANGSDPTDGSLNFHFPTTPTREPFQNRPIQTQIRVHNSFANGDVPSDTAYVNTY